MEACLGPFPAFMTRSKGASQYFDKHGRLLHSKQASQDSLHHVMAMKTLAVSRETVGGLQAPWSMYDVVHGVVLRCVGNEQPMCSCVCMWGVLLVVPWCTALCCVALSCVASNQCVFLCVGVYWWYRAAHYSSRRHCVPGLHSQVLGVRSPGPHSCQGRAEPPVVHWYQRRARHSQACEGVVVEWCWW